MDKNSATLHFNDLNITLHYNDLNITFSVVFMQIINMMPGENFSQIDVP